MSTGKVVEHRRTRNGVPYTREWSGRECWTRVGDRVQGLRFKTSEDARRVRISYVLNKRGSV